MKEIKINYFIFFKKILLLLILVIVSDLFLGKLLEHFYFKMKIGQTARITYAITRAEEALIVFGSSRANHNYVPELLEDCLHLSTYNAGIDGQSIPFHLSVLKCIKPRSSPAIIILDLNTDEFTKSTLAYDRLYALLPYYYSHKEIQPVINLRSEFEPLKAWSQLYRYNSFILPILFNNIMHRADDSKKGYVPLYKTLANQVHPIPIKIDTVLDPEKIELFKSFIKEATNSNCRVFVFVSPIFQETSTISSTINAAENICKQEQVSFINHSGLKDFKGHPEYFQDIFHLNKWGAEIYTRVVSEEIRQNMNMAKTPGP